MPLVELTPGWFVIPSSDAVDNGEGGMSVTLSEEDWGKLRPESQEGWTDNGDGTLTKELWKTD
jgi:hypothetical protein